MATKTAKLTLPFEGLRCVHCGEIDSLSVKVDTLAVQCECGEVVTRAEVEALIATWQRLFGWIESATTMFAAAK